MTRLAIFGGPGCGKTARLLDEIRDVDPDRVAFVAFTRVAAREARERAAERLGVVADDLPHFRTIHSMCFHELGLTRDQVWNEDDWAQLMADEGIAYRGRIDPSEGPVLGAEGDELRGLYEFARATGRLPSVVLEDDYPHLSPMKLERVLGALLERKEELDKIEFSDMLDEAAQLGKLPVELAIVDEAQDLSRSQWAAVRALIGRSPRFVVAGDDDQAIHVWAGADPAELIGWKDRHEVLPRSHRLPKIMFELAQRLALRIASRIPKQYLPTDRPGHIRTEVDASHVDLSEGTWLLLCRNRVHIPLLSMAAAAQGAHYSVDGVTVIKREHAIAALTWDRLCEGKRLPADQVNVALSYTSRPTALPDGLWGLPPDVDKGPWVDRFTRMTRGARTMLKLALDRGEDVLGPPRIRVATIHGAKGAEADGVVLLDRMTSRTAEGLRVNPDAEHRVWFVGATRARRELVVVDPGLPHRYGLPLRGLLL